MHQEYPKLMFGRGSATRLVTDAETEARAEHDGFTTKPGEGHRVPHRTAGPVEVLPAEPLTELHIPIIVEHVARALGGVSSDPGADAVELLTVDHIPVIVDAVFERLRGMASAATEGEAHRDALEAARGEFADGLAALKGDLLGGIAALIAAPAPAASVGKPGKA